MEVMRVLLFYFTPGLLAQASPTVPPDPFDFWPLVTPLLGDISQPCFDASMEYANGILNSSTWAIQMFDSSGHLPFLQEGLLSDTQPLYLCGILEVLLGENPCPPALQNYPLMIPFGYGVGLGDQDSCTSVSQVPTHFCHNGLTMGDPTEAKAKGIEAQPHTRHPLQALDGEHMMRIRKQPINNLLKNQSHFPRKQNSSLTSTAQHGLPPFPFENILQRNPAIQKIIKDTTDDLSKIIQSVCPDCKATNGEGQLLMTWAILWWFANMNNGGGGFPGTPTAWPAYRGCYPAACTKWDVMTNSAKLGELYGVQGMSIVGIVGIPEDIMAQYGLDYDPLPGCSSDERYNNENWADGNYVAVTIFSALGLLLLVGTLYDVYLRSTAETRLPEMKQENVDQQNKYLLSFSVLLNLEFILSTKATGSDRLDCIEGIRAISMTWVVLGHSFLFSNWFLFVNNKMYTLDPSQIGGLGFRAIIAGDYSVDSFFFIGATLVSYLLLKDLDKTNGWGNMKGFIHMVFLYVNRILRISIPYAIYILYVAGIQNLLFKEPMDVGTYTEQVAMECRNHWTANLLYVQDFLSEGSGSCVGQAWFLGTDMWFFVFAPLIIYPLWMSKFNSLYKVAAYAWWFMFLTFSVAWCIRCTFEFTDWVPGEIPCWMDVVQSQDFAVYGRRNQCYIVGLLLGHFLHITKGKKINIPPAVNLLIWEAVLLLFFALVYAPYETDLEDASSGKPTTRFWYACSHMMWGLCLSWLVFACCRGLGGIVNDFLTWSGWSVIAKISFMTYLVHMDIMFIFFASQVRC